MKTLDPKAPLLLAALLSGCAALGVDAAHVETRAVDDALTNVQLYAAPFPAVRCEPLPREVIDRYRPAAGARPWPFVAAREARTIVSTDVDDTLVASLWDRERYARGTLYPGVLALLEAEGGARGPGALVALTARPSAEPTRRELCAWLHPPSDEACANIGVSTGEIENVVDSLGMGLVKAEALLAELGRFPPRKVVFNGDSGQGDWIAALVVRDFVPGPARFYAAIHDVRAWSAPHREELHERLQDSEALFDLYRRHLLKGEDEAMSAYVARLTLRLRRIRERIDAGPTGPYGRLNGTLLRVQHIFLHRSYPELALELADAKLISDADADRVIADALPSLCFLPEGDVLGFDAGERARLIQRLDARARLRGAVAR